MGGEGERVGGEGHRVRLRQAVLVAGELERVAGELRAALGLCEPFRDPGVAQFGLANVVFALGDCFIEIVSPVREQTAAGRYMERHGGDGGYMALFDVEDLDGARLRARESDVRVVWQIDLQDISGTHLHPADMRGAIVSLDRSRPYGSWRWGGPQWTGRTSAGAPGELAGITVAVADPAAVAARWAHVLGVQVTGGAEPAGAAKLAGGAELAGAAEPAGAELALDGGWVRFTNAAAPAGEGIVEIAVRTPSALPGGRDAVEIGGVRVRRVGAAG